MIITSKFGDPRPAPLNTHQGIDCVFSDPVIKFPKGIERGRVIYLGHEGKGLGNFVIYRSISSDNKCRYLVMAHFEVIYVKVGDISFPGDRVGLQGRSGNATDKHVHIELYEPVNPEGIL